MKRAGEHIDRNEYPGGRWLFVKVYGSPAMCDRLLTDTLFPAIERMRGRHLVKRWFFIRYNDPGFHLRGRVELSGEPALAAVMQSFRKALASLCEARRLHKYMVDTYERELERYGQNVMDLTETLFSIDSDCVCRVLTLLQRGGIEFDRWKTAFLMADRLLEAFGHTITVKRDLINTMAGAYLREFGYDEHNVKQVASQYRKLKNELDAVFRFDNELDGCRDVIDGYMQELQKVLASADKGAVDLRSVLHMTMNRLFASKNRLNEMMLHYCLERWYTSEIIRSNNR